MADQPVFQLEGVWKRLMHALAGKQAGSHVNRMQQGQLVLRALRSMMAGR